MINRLRPAKAARTARLRQHLECVTPRLRRLSYRGPYVKGIGCSGGCRRLVTHHGVVAEQVGHRRCFRQGLDLGSPPAPASRCRMRRLAYRVTRPAGRTGRPTTAQQAHHDRHEPPPPASAHTCRHAETKSVRCTGRTGQSNREVQGRVGGVCSPSKQDAAHSFPGYWRKTGRPPPAVLVSRKRLELRRVDWSACRPNFCALLLGQRRQRPIPSTEHANGRRP